MLEWLLHPDRRITFYTLMVVAGFVVLLIWSKTRKRSFLIALGGLGMLGVIYALLAAFVETPQKEIMRNLDAMAAAVKVRNTDNIFRHIAEDFQFRGMNKKEFRQRVELLLVDRGLVEELKIWDPEWPESEHEEERIRPVVFKAKPISGRTDDTLYYLVRAKFVRESDFQWRLREFEVYNPFVDSEQPLAVPGLR